MESGIILVNKPVGISTFDCIRAFKRQTGFTGKVGHAGTLDVFASGLVILLLGKATRDFAQFQGGEKEYIASARLGISSNTLDIEGTLVEQSDAFIPKREQIEETMKNFVGEYDQKVPKFSAAKFQGQPLYKLARQGKTVVNRSKVVKVSKLELIGYKYPVVTFRVVVSSGTYVRQLSWDLFRKLNIDSFLFSLSRTKVGVYTLSQAKELSDLTLVSLETIFEPERGGIV